MLDSSVARHRLRGLCADDTVTTATGEKLVGEIMKVEKDVLTFSTAYSDSDFKIKWDQVASIDSTRQFLIETFDGRRAVRRVDDGCGEQGRAGRGSHHPAGGGVRDAAVRAIVLVEVRVGPRLRLQHDAGERRHTAHARRQPLVQGRARRGYRPRQRVQELAVERARHAALGSRERLPLSPRRSLVREHHPGLPEQRRAGPRPSHHDWRRRRTVPASLGVAVPGRRRRAGLDERGLHGPRDRDEGLGQRRISARSS